MASSGRSIVECPKCKEPFSILPSRGGPYQDDEEIRCPHCGMVSGHVKTSGVLDPKPLTPEQRKEWSKRSKKR